MILSFSPLGYDGSLVNVECDLRRGIPTFDIVGLSDGCVASTRERVMCAIKNSGLEFPKERVLISLSPADLKKEGAGFDLPIALDILLQDSFLNENWNDEDVEEINKTHVLVMGELELNGKVRPVKGIYGACTTALAEGIEYAIVPKGADVPVGIKVCEVDTVDEAFEALVQIGNPMYFKEKCFEPEGFSTAENIMFDEVPKEDSLDSVEGKKALKYAMTVAVAGRHHMLVWGSNGSGKTSTLKHIPELMPLLTFEESKSTSRIYSLGGVMKPNESYIRHRPFRMPHQTASIEGMCGGGSNCSPGEVSFAHNGVLFLDEAAEFRSSVLQFLRVVADNHNICLSRAGRHTIYPAKCQFVLSTIPCPCGNLGRKDKVCLCSAKAVEQFWHKFTAPLIDRIGIRFDADNISSKCREVGSLDEARTMIATAWKRQLKRQGKLNEDLTDDEVKKFIKVSEEGTSYLADQSMINSLSPRSKEKILKLARTIADMSSTEHDSISKEHIEVALGLHNKMPEEYL